MHTLPKVPNVPKVPEVHKHDKCAKTNQSEKSEEKTHVGRVELSLRKQPFAVIRFTISNSLGLTKKGNPQKKYKLILQSK